MKLARRNDQHYAGTTRRKADCLAAAASRDSAANRYTAIIQRDGKWWIGWIEEIPGACSQGRTRKELLENL